MTQRIPTDDLAALIAQKRQALGLLRDLSRRQVDAAVQGQLSGLLQILSAKQKVLELLQAIDRGLTPFAGEDPEKRTWRSQADRQKCRTQLEECELLLAEVLACEQQADAELRRQRDAAAQELSAAATAADARRAYAGIQSRPVRHSVTPLESG